MPTTLLVIDSFTDKPFGGNPAAVCILDGPADETWMKGVAREMNLAETAFLHRVSNAFSLRWLTPAVEVTLCGHATLAAAFALWQEGILKPGEIARFQTLSGELVCRCEGEWITMDFPAVPCEASPAPKGLSEALDCELAYCGYNGMDYLVEVANAEVLRGLKPNLTTLSTLPMRGLIITSRSEVAEFDFISRFFAPAVGVSEDPVTGSAHCALGPYWQPKLGKSDFTAYQASERGGVVKLSVMGDRVLLRGQAVMMSRVELLH